MNDITIIGAAIVDVLVQPCNESVFVNGSHACETISMTTGGDALNEAIILASMRDSVHLISVFGNDDAGRYIVSKCDEHAISLAPFCMKDMTTGINVVLVKEDGSRHFLTNKNGSLRKLSLSDIQLNFDGNILCFASIFVFPEIGDSQLHTIFSYAKKKQMIVCADMTKCKRNETVNDLKMSLPLIDYLFCNEEEAYLVTKQTDTSKAASILYKAGVKNVIIKAGANGCFVKNSQFENLFPLKESVPCIDTTGAGDSFVAGFIHMLNQNRDFVSCIEFANVCGSSNVQFVGATTWLDNKEFDF